VDELAERVHSLAEAACARHDVELVDAAVKRGRTTLVRVTVDSEEGVDLDTCAAVSESLSRLLDADDPLPERYTLEVTSPGADRPLRTSRDFRRNLGRPIRVRSGDSETTGECVAVDEESVTLRAEDGQDATVALASIDDARVVLPW